MIRLEGILLENIETATVHKDRTNTHKSKDPSCDPHTAEALYKTGSCVLEFSATYLTEKSFVKNALINTKKATAIQKPCAQTNGFASCEREVLF